MSDCVSNLRLAELRALWSDDKGAGRDIYVEATDVDDWQRTLEALVARWPTAYLENRQEVPMPSSAAEILRRRSEVATLLEVHLPGIDMAVHFFEVEQVEFTFEPGEAADDDAVRSVLDFVAEVGRSLRRPVHMTVESHADDRPEDDLRYDPALDRIVWPSRQ